MLRKILFRRLLLPLMAALFGTAPALAVVTYTFNGTCTDCGNTVATGVLKLTDAYPPGSNLTLGEFVSFDYTSTLFPAFSYTSAISLLGILPTSSGAAAFSLIGTTSESTTPTSYFAFTSNVDTTWSLIALDEGFDGVWTLLQTPSVPEPATWAMMLGGFALAGASVRASRRTRTSFQHTGL
jgi:hypothetical protein